jgi:hypothetical protein
MVWVGASTFGAVIGWLTLLIMCPDKKVGAAWPSLFFAFIFWSGSAAILWFHLDGSGLVVAAIGALLGIAGAKTLHRTPQAR